MQPRIVMAVSLLVIVFVAACGGQSGAYGNRGWAIHVVRTGSEADLAAVAVTADVEIRPEGVESVYMPFTRNSGTNCGWLYLQPGTHRLHLQFSAQALNEVLLTVTVEPRGIYELTLVDQEIAEEDSQHLGRVTKLMARPALRRVAPGEPLAQEAAERWRTWQRGYHTPAPLEVAPDVGTPRGVVLSMFLGIAEFRHARRSAMLVFRSGGRETVMGIDSDSRIGNNWTGMPSHLLSIASDLDSDWHWTVLIPPVLDISSATIDAARQDHRERSEEDAPAIHEVMTRQGWRFFDFTPDERSALVGSDFEIVSLPLQGNTEVKSIFKTEELNSVWQGKWRLEDARVTPNERSLFFIAKGRVRGNPRIGRLDFEDRAVSDLGAGGALALSPDGTWVATTSYDGNQGGQREEIRVLPLSAGGQPVTTLKTAGLHPVEIDWSPDGKTLAFTARTSGGARNVFVLRLSDGRVLPVTTVKGLQLDLGKDQRDGCDHPTWSPGGDLFFHCSWWRPRDHRVLSPEIWRIKPPM